MLRYKHTKDYFFMEQFFATGMAGKSTRQNTYVQMFVREKGFVYVATMKKRSDVLKEVKQFSKDIGASEVIICDHSKEKTSKDIRIFLMYIGTNLRLLEEVNPWLNRAELYIGLIKEDFCKDMKESNCTIVIWDYCVERRSRINNLTAKDLFQLHGYNAYTATFSVKVCVSKICRFGWNEWCYYCEQTNKFPLNQEVLVFVLLPARGESN